MVPIAKDTPEWLKHAVIYEIYLPSYSSLGTFEGVTEDLERIKELGTDIIWLMPIHPIGELGRKGTYGSPYAIKDYRQINPLLGNETDLLRLITKTHELDMKIIIDVVYNHTSRDSVLVQEHPEWFIKDEAGSFIRKVADWSDIYDLDYTKPELWDYQIATLKHWLDLGIDGFRCDVAAMVPLEFWKQARQRLNREREVIWLGESVGKGFVKFLRDAGFVGLSDVEVHQAFDITYDYDGFEYLQDYFRGKRELKDYLNYLFIQETLYPQHAIKLRFIENHDLSRIGNIITNKKVLKNWVVFFSLLPGATLVNAGQEILATQTIDFFEKELFDWGKGDQDFYEFFGNVLRLSKEIKSNCRDFRVEELSEGLVKLAWRGNQQQYVALVNLTELNVEVETGFLTIDENLCLDQVKEIVLGNLAAIDFPIIVKKA